MEAAVVDARPSFSVVDAYLRVLQGQRAQDLYLALSAQRRADLPMYVKAVAEIPSLERYASSAMSYAQSFPDSDNADMSAFRAQNELDRAQRRASDIIERMRSSELDIPIAEARYAAVLGEVLEDVLRCFPTGGLPALVVAYTLEPFTPFVA